MPSAIGETLGSDTLGRGSRLANGDCGARLHFDIWPSCSHKVALEFLAMAFRVFLAAIRAAVKPTVPPELRIRPNRAANS